MRIEGATVTGRKIDAREWTCDASPSIVGAIDMFQLDEAISAEQHEGPVVSLLERDGDHQGKQTALFFLFDALAFRGDQHILMILSTQGTR
jgi:hypothetical protein